MKKIFTLIVVAMLLVSAFQLQAQRNAIYPGVTDTVRLYQAPRATVAPLIDGIPTDAAWSLANWKSGFGVTPIIDWVAPATPVEPEGAFSSAGDVSFKYKIVWDAGYYYMLMRFTDDKIIYSDLHNGYRTGSIPSYASLITGTSPALGAGDGSSFQSHRMDQIAYWFTPYTDALLAGATYSRPNNGLFQTFFPGKLTDQATHAEAILWAPKHNPVSTVSGAPQTHQGTVAGTYNSGENAFYIEFRDENWANLFASVRTKLTGQKLYDATIVPAVGDKFLLQGEVNDADGITNRRDYSISFSQTTLASSKSPLTNLSEAMVVELVETVSTGLKNSTTMNKLDVYPNPATGSVINLNSAADVKIFSLSGRMILESKNASKIDISSLNQGVYLVKDNAGNINKLVRQ